jgi:hypothetical protein
MIVIPGHPVAAVPLLKIRPDPVQPSVGGFNGKILRHFSLRLVKNLYFMAIIGDFK